MRIRKPCVHRSKAGFRSIPDEYENERELHNCCIEPCRHGNQRCPAQADFADLIRSGVIHQNSSQECEGNTYGRDDQVFVGGF